MALVKVVVNNRLLRYLWFKNYLELSTSSYFSSGLSGRRQVVAAQEDGESAGSAASGAVRGRQDVLRPDHRPAAQEVAIVLERDLEGHASKPLMTWDTYASQ